MDPREVTVVIPAAGRIPEGLLAMANVTSPAMIPMAGRPVIFWTISYLKDLGVRRFVVAVKERGLFVEDFLRCTFGATCEIDFVVPDRDGGVGYTVRCCAQKVKTRAALVVLGDTHFKLADPTMLFDDSSWVLTSPVTESYRWCIAELDDAGAVRRLVDKPDEWPGEKNALIGVYKLADARRLLESSEAAVQAADGAPVQLSHLLDRYRQATPLFGRPAAEWLDCGNPDNQMRSQRKMLQKRAFNELQVDETFGTITKRSTNVDKFIDEINYLKLLPPDLSVLFPRVLEADVATETPSLVMEYYGYPTLAELFLYQQVHVSVWERVFQHLLDVIERGLMRYRRPVRSADWRTMYLEKPQQRLEDARRRGSPALRELVSRRDDVVLNGRPLRSIERLWPEIEALLPALQKPEHSTIIHGDLCFSNILYDLRGGICKLVDPRGSFGSSGVHGDIKYDVAKLNHSARGHYDFVVNDLFRLEADGGRFELEMLVRPSHGAIGEAFERTFLSRFDRLQVEVATGLLFVSMPPLHYDAPRRQLAMYLTGLRILNEALA